jgi:hypothetical protein
VRRENFFVLLLIFLLSFELRAQNPVDSLLNAIFDSTARVSVDSSKLSFADTTKHWKFGGQVTAILSQSGFHNWAAGGEPSLAMNTSTNLFLAYKKDSTVWFNDLDLSYGFLKKGKGEPNKNDDRIEFTSKYNRKSSVSKLEYTGLLLFQSQLFRGYSAFSDSTKVSGFLSPAYILTSLGFDYLPAPKTRITIAPVTGKLTIVVNEDIASLESFFNTLFSFSKYVRYEFGGFVKLEAEGKITDDLSYKTRLGLFSNYVRNPFNIDVDWQTQMNLKISKYISLSLKAHLIYDDDIKILVGTGANGQPEYGPRLQVKEILGAGFLWKFGGG